MPESDQRISYEDSQSMMLKAQWAKEQDIGGVFFWEISQDYLNGDNYLLRSAWQALQDNQ